MNPQIAALLDLQTIDLKLLRLEKKLEASPKALAEAQTEFQRQLSSLDQKLQALKTLQVHIDSREGELRDLEQRADKYRQQQLQRGIKNKEYQALSHEIQAVKANASFLQDGIIGELEKLEAAKKEAEELRTGVEAARNKLQEQEAQVAKEVEEVRKALEGIRKQRAQAADRVDKELVSRYERILRGKSSKAIVEVLDNVCQGCFMSLTPQMALNLRSGTDIVFCQSCARMLYLP